MTVTHAVDHHAWIGTESVDTPFGDFEFAEGYPTPEATRRLFELRTFNRAVEVYTAQCRASRCINYERDSPTSAPGGPPGRDLENAHGRRDRLADRQLRDGVRDGVSRPQARRPDGGRGAAGDAGRVVRHVAARVGRHRPHRRRRGKGGKSCIFPPDTIRTAFRPAISRCGRGPTVT